MTLTDYDKTRYARQILLDGWGEEGQRHIKESKVFVIGAGGLGSPVTIYLAVAGVGELCICDADQIELSNLNRQILHSDERVGELKALSAEKSLQALNPSIKLTVVSERLEECNAEKIIGTPDIIVDCLDNFDTRYLVNAYAVQHHIPLVHAAVWGLTGHITFIHAPETPCLRCIFPEALPRQIFPVVGVTPGVIGCLQAMETLKYLAGVGTTLKGRMLVFDGEDMSFFPANVKRLEDCPHCGKIH